MGEANPATLPPTAYKIKWSGRGAAEAHLLWEQGVVGSIPAAPTITTPVLVQPVATGSKLALPSSGTASSVLGGFPELLA